MIATMGRKRQNPLQEDPPAPIEPTSRLPTEPWMKWGGASLWASLIVWFRMPKRIRKETMTAAGITMLLVAGVVAAAVGVFLLFRLFDWIQSS